MNREKHLKESSVKVKIKNINNDFQGTEQDVEEKRDNKWPKGKV